MEFIIFIVFICIIIVTFYLIIKAPDQRIIEEERKKKFKEFLKEKAEIEIKLQEERIEKYGQLTKQFSYTTNENNMQVYQESKIIFIEGTPYNFSDIISCKIETKVIRGKEIHRTVPNKQHKYNMQFLYGLNWEKHITKFDTEIIKEPDIINYTICIGINSFQTPLIRVYLGTKEELANEIYSLFDVIIQNNK